MSNQKKKRIEFLNSPKISHKEKSGPFLIWAPTLFYMALIFFFSHKEPLLATVAGDWSFPGLDKIAHFCEFSLLFFILYRSFYLDNYKNPEFKSLCLSILYSVSDEFHQSFLPYRDCEVGDVIADTAGIVVGFFVLLTYKKYGIKKQAQSILAK